MAEADPPGGGSGEGGSRFRLYRGGRARAPRAQPASPREVARRLGALERRVERALVGTGVPAGLAASDRFRAFADRALAAVASLQRLSLSDLREVGTEWSALAQTVEDDVRGALLDVLYRLWWRVEPFGLDHVPAHGPVIVVTNRGGALVPYEALMVQTSLAHHHPARRYARPLVDEWLARTPLVGRALVRGGALRGGVTGLRRALGRDEAVIVHPEGGVAKRFRDRYRLASFGRAPFARVAIETGATIVPVAVIGAEEIHPVLARLDLPGRLVGLPTLPITPTFPWLGAAGLVPLPTKWLLFAGEPLDVAARTAPSDAADPVAVARLRDQVRERLQALILEGLRRRRGIFA